MPDTHSPLTPAVFHVMLALADGPLHGYAVMKRVESDSGLAMGPGTVYGSLERLGATGWVSESASDGEDPRRGRRFALTPSGREALSAEAERLSRLARLVSSRGLTVESQPAS